MDHLGLKQFWSQIIRKNIPITKKLGAIFVCVLHKFRNVGTYELADVPGMSARAGANGVAKFLGIDVPSSLDSDAESTIV